MKLGIKCLIVLAIVAMTSLSVSASDTTTKFKTGPFSVSVDLGKPCNDTNISKPVSSETLKGTGYNGYSVDVCDAHLYIRRYDTDSFDLTSAFGTKSINTALTQDGADKDTIASYDRTIDGKSGAAGSGYVPKSEKTVYEGAFDISSKSYCFITVWGNETEMISVLKTIHITEAAT